MSSDTPSATVRASALALLADGNSIDAVSHVLGIGVDVLQAWRAGGAAVDAPPAAAPVPRARPLSFDDELVYQHPLWVRAAMAAMWGLAVALVLAMFPASRDPVGKTSSTGALVLIALVTLGLLTPVALSVVRWRFVFGHRGVSERGAWLASPELDYAAIDHVTIARDTQYVGRGARAPGHRVTFLSRVRVTEPVSLFIYDAYPLAEAVADRLRQLPGVAARDVAPLMNLPVRSRRPVGKLAGALLVAVLLALGAAAARFPRDTFGQIARGQPALPQMNHLAGDLRRFSGCGRDAFDPQRGVDATLVLSDGRTAHARLPCVMPRGVFADQRRHELSVDSWQDGGALPHVCQVRLDGLTLLSCDDVRAQRLGELWMFGLIELLFAGVWLGGLVLALRLLDDRYWAQA